MSRIGKKIINLPNNVTVKQDNDIVTVSGPLGSEKCQITSSISIKQDGNVLHIVKADSSIDKQDDALQGLYRSLISNSVTGVTQGFEKELTIIGVGYKVQQQGKDLQFSLGFSHPVVFKAPEGITLQAVDPTHVKVKGLSKQLVGQVAANIRGLKPPEPYKGKGIRYTNEKIITKAGKTGKK